MSVEHSVFERVHLVHAATGMSMSYIPRGTVSFACNGVRVDKTPLDLPTIRDGETLKDLKAAIAARAELGADMEDHVIEVFLSRLEHQIDARIDRAITKVPTRVSSGGNYVAVVAPSLALSIPAMAVAGNFAGGGGILAVMGAVCVVNGMYFIDRLLRR